VAPHDPNKVRLDDGGELHSDCAGTLLRRAMDTMSLRKYRAFAECLRRLLGEHRFARLSERVAQPRFKDARKRRADEQTSVLERTPDFQAFIEEKRLMAQRFSSPEGKAQEKPFDPCNMMC